MSARLEAAGRWELRAKSWRATIDIQRKGAATPGFKAALRDPEWQDDIWFNAIKSAIAEAGLTSGFGPEGV